MLLCNTGSWASYYLCPLLYPWRNQLWKVYFLLSSGKAAHFYSSSEPHSIWMGWGIEEGTVERKVKVLIKNLAIFFLFPSKEFLPIPFKVQLLETSPQKQKEQTKKQLGADKLLPHKYGSLKFDVFFSYVFSLPVRFEFAIFSYYLHFAKFVCLLCQ